MLKQVVRNLFSNWAGLVINVVVSFFLAPFVVRHLGNTYYGIWAVVGQFIGYLYLLDFGIRESIIRYASRFRALEKGDELESIVQVSFWFYMLIAAACFVLTAVIAFFFTSIFGVDPALRSEIAITVLLAGGTVTQLFVFNVFTGLLMGFQRYDLFNAANIVSTLIRAGLFVWALTAGYGIVALAAIQFAIALLTGLVLATKSLSIARLSGLSIKLGIPRREDVIRTQKKIVSYSVLVLINNLGQKIVFMTDAILIGLFLPVSQVTFYAIAATLVGYLRSILGSSAQLFNPLISHLSALEEDNRVRYTFTAGTRLMLFICFPVGLTFIFLGDTFIGLWMGESYKVLSGQVLIVLAVTQIVSAPHQVISSTLYGLNKHKFLAYWRVVEALLNITLSIVLVSRFGIVGVAIGTAVPHILLALVILPAYAVRQVNMSLFEYFTQGYLRPIAAAGIFAAGCLLARKYVEISTFLEFFGIVALLSIVYLAVSYVVVLSTDERKTITSGVRNAMARS